jgi:hypothetical protein
MAIPITLVCSRFISAGLAGMDRSRTSSYSIANESRTIGEAGVTVVTTCGDTGHSLPTKEVRT